MNVRLGFAVAAYLDTDILIADEVLAVGDADFQEKAIGIMQDVSTSQGRTVLFVSHNMSMIELLCPKTLLITDGKNELLDQTDRVIKKYIFRKTAVPLRERTDRQGDGSLRFTEVRLINPETGSLCHSIQTGKPINIEVDYIKDGDPFCGGFAFNICSLLGGKSLFTCRTQLFNVPMVTIEKKKGTISCLIEKFPLGIGEYSLTLYAKAGSIVTDWVRDAIRITVSNRNGYYIGQDDLTIPHSWKFS
jgi:lipopolysaccharide transport system ATP-binding protein